MCKDKNIIKVACAIIEDDDKILAAQRGKNMGFTYKWEFPGGKLEPGEKAEDCIVREIREELDVDVTIKNSLKEYIHDYGTKCIMLIPFICSIKSGELICKEHIQFVWDKPGNLLNLDWADADVPVLKEYLEYKENL